MTGDFKSRFLAKAQPIGNLRVEVPYERTFTQEEATRLRTGLLPHDMDDKWVAFLGDSSFDAWRSWTGICIYSLPSRWVQGSLVLGPLIINADQDKYRSPGMAEDVALLDRLIARTLAANAAV